MHWGVSAMQGHRPTMEVTLAPVPPCHGISRHFPNVSLSAGIELLSSLEHSKLSSMLLSPTQPNKAHRNTIHKYADDHCETQDTLINGSLIKVRSRQ